MIIFKATKYAILDYCLNVILDRIWWNLVAKPKIENELILIFGMTEKDFRRILQAYSDEQILSLIHLQAYSSDEQILRLKNGTSGYLQAY